MRLTLPSLAALVMLLPLAGLPAIRHSCEWYSVKDNGASTTRPAYTLANGVLGKKIVDRAPVGATCDLTKPTKPSNKDLWASYDSTDRVALCTKR